MSVVETVSLILPDARLLWSTIRSGRLTHWTFHKFGPRELLDQRYGRLDVLTSFAVDGCA